MIPRSQIAHYLCTSWTTTSVPNDEFLARRLDLSILNNDKHIMRIAYIIDIHACISNGLTVGPTGIQTHLRVISH